METKNKFLIDVICVRIYNSVQDKFEEYSDFQEFSLNDECDVFALLQVCKKANKYVEIALNYAD